MNYLMSDLKIQQIDYLGERVIKKQNPLVFFDINRSFKI